MMTKQQIFDKVCDHLIKQNERSLRAQDIGTKEESCAYRTPHGLRCAIGCLITDACYRDWGESIEGHDVCATEVQEALVCSGVLFKESEADDARTLELMQRLQGLHDTCPVDEWPQRLTNLGHTYGLRIPESITHLKS